MPLEPSTADRPILERVGRGRRPTIASAAAMVLAGALLVTVLVAKPWAAPETQVSESPLAQVSAESSGPSIPARAAEPLIPPVMTQGPPPIAPLDWSRIGIAIPPFATTQVGVVSRSGDGVLSLFVAARRPSEGTDIVGSALAMVGGQEVPTPNSIKVLASGSVAIVLAQPAGHALSSVIVWRIAPSSIVRIGARHPIGDEDGVLWIYPSSSAPRGERPDLAEASAAPPAWPPGTYRIDLVDAEGATRHLFVIFEPDGVG